MDILSLEIDSFCGHDKSEINFEDFNSALILGKAENDIRSSNGVGKSTIFAAIKYCFFNEVEFSSLDKIIRHGESSCKVSIQFKSSLDSNTYKVIRGRHIKTGSEIRLFKNNNHTWEDITQRRNTDTEKELSKLLKINYKTFCNSVLFSQSDVSGIASLTPADRKKLLKDALQLGIYSKYELLAKKKSSDIFKSIEEKKIILGTIGNPKDDILSHSNTITGIKAFIDDKVKSLNDLNIKKEISELDISNNKKELEDIEKSSENYQQNKKTLVEDIEKTSKLLSEYKVKFAITEKEGKSIAAEILSIKSFIETHKNKDKSPKVAEQKLIVDKLFDSKTNYKSLSAKLQELEIPLPNGSVCKHCRQNIDEASREECQKSTQIEIISVKIKLSSLKEEILSAEKASNTLQKEIQDIEKLEKTIFEKSQILITKEKEIATKRSLFSEYNENIDRNKSKLDELNNNLTKLKATVDSDKKNRFIELKEIIVKKNNEQKLLIDSISSITNENNRHYNNIAVLKSKIEERQKDEEKITYIQNTITELEKSYLLHQSVVDAFGSQGIPALITQNILDDFQEETNTYLSNLYPELQVQFFVEKENTKGDLADTLGITFTLGNNELEFSQLSGAQKLISSLCLKLGLSNVLKKRLGVEMNLLMIDEVDASLDSVRLESFEKALKILAKDFKILVISHNEQLKDAFKKAILVSQNENLVSTMSLIDN